MYTAHLHTAVDTLIHEMRGWIHGCGEERPLLWVCQAEVRAEGELKLHFMSRISLSLSLFVPHKHTHTHLG